MTRNGAKHAKTNSCLSRPFVIFVVRTFSRQTHRLHYAKFVICSLSVIFVARRSATNLRGVFTYKARSRFI